MNDCERNVTVCGDSEVTAFLIRSKHLFRKETKGNGDASSYRRSLVREITKLEPKEVFAHI
jgi:hypothetical protein